MSSELEIVDVDENGRIVLPHKLCEKIGIHPHDKLILGVKNNTLLTPIFTRYGEICFTDNTPHNID